MLGIDNMTSRILVSLFGPTEVRASQHMAHTLADRKVIDLPSCTALVQLLDEFCKRVVSEVVYMKKQHESNASKRQIGATPSQRPG
jgi:hypothetical protein